MSTSKIGIGTAQWGMPYGISNLRGQTKSSEVAKIISMAHDSGIKAIDTASLYGNAEDVLGQQVLNEFNVVTKTPCYGNPVITSSDGNDLNQTFKRSLQRMRIEKVYGLLVHHSHDLLVPGWEYIKNELCSLRDEGLVGRIGLSIYDSSNIKLLYDRLRPEIVQLPLSVLDQRLIDDGTLGWLHSLGVEIHVRSVFLQGLLLMEPDKLPDYFLPLRDKLVSWHHACRAQNLTPLQAAINFVCSIRDVNYVIIGVESEKQLSEILTASAVPREFNAADLACSDLSLLNPSNWRV
jgi:aryl-alcohol dehydrogenase-like predicted oxidoreductase